MLESPWSGFGGSGTPSEDMAPAMTNECSGLDQRTRPGGLSAGVAGHPTRRREVCHPGVGVGAGLAWAVACTAGRPRAPGGGSYPRVRCGGELGPSGYSSMRGFWTGLVDITVGTTAEPTAALVHHADRGSVGEVSIEFDPPTSPLAGRYRGAARTSRAFKPKICCTTHRTAASSCAPTAGGCVTSFPAPRVGNEQSVRRE